MYHLKQACAFNGSVTTKYVPFYVQPLYMHIYIVMSDMLDHQWCWWRWYKPRVVCGRMPSPWKLICSRLIELAIQSWISSWICKAFCAKGSPSAGTQCAYLVVVVIESKSCWSAVCRVLVLQRIVRWWFIVSLNHLTFLQKALPKKKRAAAHNMMLITLTVCGLNIDDVQSP